MEELLAYVLLLCEGFDFWEEYQETLDKLFILNPEDEVLLDLEFMSGDIKGSCLYLKAHFNYAEFNADKFGQFLMRKLAVLYKQNKLRHFAAKMYSLWQNLPEIYPAKSLSGRFVMQMTHYHGRTKSSAESFMNIC